MKGFKGLVISQIKMLIRDRMYLVGSFGIAFISMVIFGSLFGSGGTSTFSLGLVDEDGSAASQQLVGNLKTSEALGVKEGSRDPELASLRRGERRAVLIIEKGFQDGLASRRAVLKVYYDQSNMVAATAARSAVQSIVNGLNRSILHVEEPIKIEEEGLTVQQLRNIDFLTPGLLGMMIMWANMFIGVGLIAWREQGILKRLSATPLRGSQLIASQLSAHLIFSFLQAAVLLAIAILWFKVSVQGSYLLLALAILTGVLSMSAFGYIVASFVKRSESAQSAAMLISFPMMFLGGSFFPTDAAPSYMQPLIKAFPLTYLNHALREIINNAAGLATIQNDLFVLMAWMAGCFLIATRLFRWQ